MIEITLTIYHPDQHTIIRIHRLTSSNMGMLLTTLPNI